MCQNFTNSISKVLKEIELHKVQKLNTLNSEQTPRVTSKPFTVLVEGNIGSGKTTFLEHFNKFSEDVEILAEPVEKWRNANGHNLLQMMYEDPYRFVITSFSLCHFHTFLVFQMEPGIPDLRPADHGTEPHQGRHHQLDIIFYTTSCSRSPPKTSNSWKGLCSQPSTALWRT